MTSLYLLQVDTIAWTCQYVRVMHYTILMQMHAVRSKSSRYCWRRESCCANINATRKLYIAEINMYSFCCEYCVVHILKIDANGSETFPLLVRVSVTNAALEDLWKETKLWKICKSSCTIFFETYVCSMAMAEIDSRKKLSSFQKNPPDLQQSCTANKCLKSVPKLGISF